jgi:hypothetical protein
MCNRYSIAKGQKAIVDLTKAMVGKDGYMPSLPSVLPNRMARAVRLARRAGAN